MNFDVASMIGKYNVKKEYTKLSKGITNIITKEHLEEIKQSEMYHVACSILNNLNEDQILAVCFILIATEEKEDATTFLGLITFYLNILKNIQEVNNG